MQFKWHVLFGFVASYLLVYFFHFSFLSGAIIFLSSFMIDFDHYLWYGFLMGDWDPKNAINWGLKVEKKWAATPLIERKKFQRGIFVFHSLFFWIILALLSFYLHTFFLWVLIGVMIHMVADFSDLLYKKEPLYNKILPCLVVIKNKGKKSLKEF